MIQFAIPGLLGAGLLGAAVVTALHFLSVRRPPELLLPTARFLDEGRVRAVSSSAQPSDLWLLLLRVAALLLASAAFARPQWVSRSHRVARLIVADVAARRDSAALLPAIVAPALTESLTRFVWTDSLDAAGAPSGLRAELAAAFPSALRAATALSAERTDVDSIMLYVVAPLGANVDTDSWRAWRAVWPGAVHVVPPASLAAAPVPAVRFDGVGADDVLRSAFITRAPNAGLPTGANGARPNTRDVAVRRTPSSLATASPASASPASASPASASPASASPASASPASASPASASPASASPASASPASASPASASPASASPASASPASAAPASASPASASPAASGGVTIVWPENGMLDGWPPASDTVGAVAAHGLALVAVWVRASTPSAASMRGAHAIAWWSDGTPAAIERPQGLGCIREVGIVVPPATDLLLDASADGLMSALLAPCANAATGARALPQAIAADSLDTTKGAAAPASYFRAMERAGDRSSPNVLAEWLLAFALALLALEWLVRDRDDRDRGDRSGGAEGNTARTDNRRAQAAP